MPRAKRKQKGGTDVPAVLGVLFAPTATTRGAPPAPVVPAQITAVPQGVSTQRTTPASRPPAPAPAPTPPAAAPAAASRASPAASTSARPAAPQPEITPASPSGSSQHPSSPLPSLVLTYDITSDELYNAYKSYVEGINTDVPKQKKFLGLFKKETSEAPTIAPYIKLQQEIFKYNEKIIYDSILKLKLKELNDYKLYSNYNITDQSVNSYLLASLVELQTNKPTIMKKFYRMFKIINIVESTKDIIVIPTTIKNLIVFLMDIKDTDLQSSLLISNKNSINYTYLSSSIYDVLIAIIDKYQLLNDLRQLNEIMSEYSKNLTIINKSLFKSKLYLLKQKYKYTGKNFRQFIILKINIKNISLEEKFNNLIKSKSFNLLTESLGGKKKPRRPRKPKQR